MNRHADGDETDRPAGRQDQPIVVGTRRPRRRRVVLAERRGSRPVRRAIVELEEQTATGDELLRGLMRAQLRLALGLSLFTVSSIGILPAAFWLFPRFAALTVLGVRVPWLLLGALVFPLLAGIGYWYYRVAEHNEKVFVQSVGN